MPAEQLNVVLRLVTGQYKTEAQQAANATGRIGDAAQSSSGRLNGLAQRFGALKTAGAGAA